MYEVRQDLDDDNILINWIGGRYRLPDAMAKKRIDPFRSLFPIRYYLNDFEFAVTFDPGSEPSSRLVTGIPSDGIRTGEYERDPVPEMLSEAPYCPFRADIWQLGNLFMSCFGVRVKSHSSFICSVA
jgi:serine/threonine protein kinase